jgi:hypothetical protein
MTHFFMCQILTKGGEEVKFNQVKDFQKSVSPEKGNIREERSDRDDELHYRTVCKIHDGPEIRKGTNFS